MLAGALGGHQRAARVRPCPLRHSFV